MKQTAIRMSNIDIYFIDNSVIQFGEEAEMSIGVEGVYITHEGVQEFYPAIQIRCVRASLDTKVI